MKPALLILLLSMSLPAARATADTPVSESETVVLLHGLGRTRWSMSRLECSLRREGYRVVNVTYPSRSLSLERLASEWLPELLRAQRLDTTGRVHFVTHSMGGIVVRLWLANSPPPANLGRIVMLAPPNQGSDLSDRLQSFPPFRFFTGVNGGRLGKGAGSVPVQLGPIAGDADVGIVAGNRTLNPLFSSWIPGPDDGKVAVASARVEGMRGFKVVPHSHTWLAWRQPVIDEVSSFLRTGAFSPDRPAN